MAELSKRDESAVKTLLNASESPATRFESIHPDEVLSLLVEAKLTKHQYLVVRELINTKTCSAILPSYHSVIRAKKKCYPSNQRIDETAAEVELQNLLDHTVSRVIEAHQEDIGQKMLPDVSQQLILIGKWGFDGSSGHSEYKQSFNEGCSEDGSIFVTSYVPLQLKIETSTAENLIIWKNPRPSSTRYCRPIRFQFIKETTELSVREERYFKEKIRNLIPTQVFINDREYLVKHLLQLTMVDGKVSVHLKYFYFLVLFIPHHVHRYATR